MPEAPDAPFVIDIEAQPTVQAAEYVIGARSLLMDRAVPLPEIIVIPPRRSGQSHLRLSYDGSAGKLEPIGSWKRKLAESVKLSKRPGRGVPILDLRPIGPNNWSHALNIAFPLALMVRDRFRSEGLADPVFVCPAKMPGRIMELFERFDLSVLCTSGAVKGSLIVADPADPNEQVLCHYRDWIAPHAEGFRALIAEGAGEIPDRVFLDRRDGRTIANGDAVRGYLEERGFSTVYPEDLSLAQQFALLCTPSQIVAIHGAGIAPLMFRQPEAGPFRFVEILTPGHMTVYFRKFTQGLPGDFRMLRGKPSAKMSAAAYDPATEFTDYARTFSLAPFEVDLATLDLALRPERIEDILAAGEPLDYADL